MTSTLRRFPVAQPCLSDLEEAYVLDAHGQRTGEAKVSRGKSGSVSLEVAPTARIEFAAAGVPSGYDAKQALLKKQAEEKAAAEAKKAEAKARADAAKADQDSKGAKGKDQAKEAPKGQEKQAEKKAAQPRKEEGKGSEQGQAKRAENSRKWWKFWGDKEEAAPAPSPAPAPAEPAAPPAP